MANPEHSTAAEMRASLNDMDRISQEAFEKIEIYATAIDEALSKMEPRMHGALGLLELIRFEASSGSNDINCEAEKWGACYREDEMPDARRLRLESGSDKRSAP